jgi:hypothetical protein
MVARVLAGVEAVLVADLLELEFVDRYGNFEYIEQHHSKDSTNNIEH